MSLWQLWKRWARGLKARIYTVYLAYQDPRTPWYAKVFAACVVGYAFSPIDLIPDFIPILGYLDDLIIVPIGLALAVKMIPPQVLADSQLKAQQAMAEKRPKNFFAAGLIVALWVLLAALSFYLIVRVVNR